MMGKLDTLVEKVERAVRQRRLLKRRQTVLVGVSGGADSVALLLALVDLSARWKFRLHVGHLHHGIRGRTADRDREFVRSLAKELGLPFHTERRDVPKVARRGKMSIEEAARDVRYAFLLRIAKRVGAKRIAIAHQADDQVETVLGNILRGTSLSGLAGMPYSRSLDGPVMVVRPLLDVTRKEVLRFLSGRRQKFVEDPTNRDSQYRRNRLRNKLLPLLRRKFNPQVDSALLRLSQQARSAETVLEKALQRTYARVVKERLPGRAIVNRRKFCRLPEWIQGRLLRQIIETLGGGLARLGSQTTFDLCRQLASAESGTTVRLTGGLSAYVDYESIIIGQGRKGIRLPEGTGRRGFGGQAVAAELKVRRRSAKGFDLKKFAAKKSPLEEVLDADAVVPPLRVRPVRRGDVFRPLGAPGRVKVSDFFTNSKVPRRKRVRAKVLVDAKGIVWLIGHRLAHRARVTGRTERLLHVSF